MIGGLERMPSHETLQGNDWLSSGVSNLSGPRVRLGPYSSSEGQSQCVCWLALHAACSMYAGSSPTHGTSPCPMHHTWPDQPCTLGLGPNFGAALDPACRAGLTQALYLARTLDQPYVPRAACPKLAVCTTARGQSGLHVAHGATLRPTDSSASWMIGLHGPHPAFSLYFDTPG